MASVARSPHVAPRAAPLPPIRGQLGFQFTGEIWSRVFSCLGPSELLALERVNRQFRLVHSEPFRQAEVRFWSQYADRAGIYLECTTGPTIRQRIVIYMKAAHQFERMREWASGTHQRICRARDRALLVSSKAEPCFSSYAEESYETLCRLENNFSLMRALPRGDFYNKQRLLQIGLAIAGFANCNEPNCLASGRDFYEIGFPCEAQRRGYRELLQVMMESDTVPRHFRLQGFFKAGVLQEIENLRTLLDPVGPLFGHLDRGNFGRIDIRRPLAEIFRANNLAMLELFSGAVAQTNALHFDRVSVAAVTQQQRAAGNALPACIDMFGSAPTSAPDRSSLLPLPKSLEFGPYAIFREGAFEYGKPSKEEPLLYLTAEQEAAYRGDTFMYMEQEPFSDEPEVLPVAASRMAYWYRQSLLPQQQNGPNFHAHLYAEERQAIRRSWLSNPDEGTTKWLGNLIGRLALREVSCWKSIERLLKQGCVYFTPGRMQALPAIKAKAMHEGQQRILDLFQQLIPVAGNRKGFIPLLTAPTASPWGLINDVFLWKYLPPKPCELPPPAPQELSATAAAADASAKK